MRLTTRRSGSKFAQENVPGRAKVSSHVPINPANDATGKPLESRCIWQPSPEKNNKTKSLVDLCSMRRTSTRMKYIPLEDLRRCPRDEKRRLRNHHLIYAIATQIGPLLRRYHRASLGRRQPSPEKNNTTKRLVEPDSMQNTTTGSKDRRGGSTPSERQKKRRHRRHRNLPAVSATATHIWMRTARRVGPFSSPMY
jgi:hypothetical protein